MKKYNAITFAAFTPAGTYPRPEVMDSLNAALDTGANMIVLAPTGYQATPHSEEITYNETCTDEELINMAEYIHSKGVQVCIKPITQCKDGTWRAFINFFDKDVVCEPKWSNWFKSYTAFICHYAELAEKVNAEMFIAGCEMVMSERREAEWRQVIADIKKVYSGPVCYNTDKYQEDNVQWWDAVDIIGASGYYPIDNWEEQLDRIEAVVKKFNRPFFFAEYGCMSVEGSSNIPNKWDLPGGINLQEQADWYAAAHEAINKRDWIIGTCVWDWAAVLYKKEQAAENRGYDTYGKPAELEIRKQFKS